MPHAGDDPSPGSAAHGNFSGRCKLQPVLATEMLKRNSEAALFVCTGLEAFSAPEVNSTRGLKTLTCGQCFSDSGGLEVTHSPPHPQESELSRAPASSPFQDLRRPRPEQTFVRREAAPARGGGRGRGLQPPGRAARCRTGAGGASNSWLLKLPGATWLPRREGMEARKGWLA